MTYPPRLKPADLVFMFILGVGFGVMACLLVQEIVCAP